ncbi:MAG TPA: VOC family protein [Actinomycetota bacterium]|nr:VOC family protein [Actinomycetota bacterium]
MTSILDTVTFDCADPARLAEFWARSLGWEVGEVDDEGADVIAGGESGDAYARPAGTTEETPWQGLYFQKVPEGKVVKNRVHLDLRPLDSMAAEVERSIALGATVQQRVDVEDSFWTVMLDPEGNEFCILRGPEDGWAPNA